MVLSLKMTSISNCFHLTLTPVHFLKPLTAMSDRLYQGELKCSAQMINNLNLLTSEGQTLLQRALGSPRKHEAIIEKKNMISKTFIVVISCMYNAQ